VGIASTAFPLLLAQLVPCRPVLLEAFLAVNWTAFGRFERDLGFLAAVRADDLVHLPGAAVVTAPLSITHNFHSFYVAILRIC
jgi:hypothetical protein